MKTKLFIVFFALCYCQHSVAQVTQQWAVTHNGTGNNSDQISVMFVDASGNSYVTGSSTNISSNFDIVTIKYNSAGIQQWLATYNGSVNSNDFANSIAVDASGNTYVTGQTYNGTNNYDIVTIKYNSAGVQQWASTYNGTPGNGADNGRAIAVSSAGDVFITGLNAGGSGGTITIKYNSAGVQQWATIFSGGGGAAIAVDISGNSYVATNSGNITTIMYNNSGSQQWATTYTTSTTQDYGKAIKVDPSGNVYVTGGLDGGFGTKDIATLKYNNSGVQQWATVYNSNDDDSPTGLDIDVSGNVFVSGYIFKVNSTFDYDGVTLQYNSSGVQQWATIYNPPGNTNNQNNSVITDNSGNVFVTGYESLSAKDVVTIKYNNSGIHQWLINYNGPISADDVVSAIGLDGSGNVYVAGFTDTATTSTYDYVVIKYSQSPSSITKTQIPFNNINIYPNPTSDQFFIETNATGKLNVDLFDVNGRQVFSANVMDKSNINVANLDNGAYTLTIKTADRVINKKLVILR